MKTLPIFSVILLFCLSMLLFSCSKEDAIAPITDDQVELRQPRKKDHVVIPFKGKYKTFVQILGPPVDGWLSLDIRAEGNATHLGNSTWTGIQQSFIFSDPQLIICDEIIFTAANGDQLIGWYDGLGYGSPFSPEGVSFEGKVYITHGTNRFKGVTGEIPYSGTAAVLPDNPFIGEGEITFYDGFLDY